MRKTTGKKKATKKPTAKVMKTAKTKSMAGRKGYAKGGAVAAAEERRKKYQSGGYGAVGSRSAIKAHQAANEKVESKARASSKMLGSGAAARAAEKIERRGTRIEEELKKSGG